MHQIYRPLLDALSRRGIDAADVQEAVSESERTGRSLREVLLKRSFITEFGLAGALADAHGLASVDLVGYPVEPAAAARIPFPVVLRHRLLGIAIAGDELVVAISDPDDVVALDDVRSATGMLIRPVVVARSELRKLIDRLKRQDNDLDAVGGSGAPRTGRCGRPDGGRRRRRTVGAVRELPSRAGDPVACIRSPSRTHRGRHAGPVPHRRGSARDRQGAGQRPVRPDLATEDHVEHRHHRTAVAAERSDHRAAQRTQRRHVRRRWTVWGEKSCSGCSTPKVSISN